MGNDPPEIADVEQFAGRAMGSPLRLTVVGADPADAARAWQLISDEVERHEAVLSRFRSSSDLVALNRAAGDPEPRPVPPALARALAAADAAHRRTGGVFEPRVLVDLERLGYRGVDLPAPPGERPGPRATFADGSWLHLEPRANRAAVAAPVDLGGIGKGLVLRWAMRRLAGHLGPAGSGPGALLEAGGDLVAHGPAPAGGPWHVGIEDPAGGDDLAVVATDGGAIATSSTRVRSWRGTDGRPVHHLIEPRTGEPGGSGLAAVTVAGPDPAWAEVWSKVLFLEGSQRIGPRARSLGLAAWWVHADGLLEMTPAARPVTIWIAGEA